jgi:hypothetical protein
MGDLRGRSCFLRSFIVVSGLIINLKDGRGEVDRKGVLLSPLRNICQTHPPLPRHHHPHRISAGTAPCVPVTGRPAIDGGGRRCGVDGGGGERGWHGSGNGGAVGSGFRLPGASAAVVSADGAAIYTISCRNAGVGGSSADRRVLLSPDSSCSSRTPLAYRLLR